MRYDEEENNGKQNRQVCIIDHGIGDCRINTSGEPGRNRRYESGDIWGMATKAGKSQEKDLMFRLLRELC